MSCHQHLHRRGTLTAHHINANKNDEGEPKNSSLSTRNCRRQRLLICLIIAFSLYYMSIELHASKEKSSSSLPSKTTITTTTAASSSPIRKHDRKKKKKIGFVHFHKAGGTSVVKTLLKHYQGWEPNRNGNPWDCCDLLGGHEYMVKFWNYNSAEFQQFIQRTQKKDDDKKKNGFQSLSSKQNQNNKQFANGSDVAWELVAMEWNFFTHLTQEEVLAHMDLITCLRDPYDRFVSNLYFQLAIPKRTQIPDNLKHADRPHLAVQYYAKNPKEWMDLNYTQSAPIIPKYQTFALNFNKPNYYTAFLNGLGEESHDERIPLTSRHLNIAKERLKSWFTAIIILENNTTHHKSFVDKLGLPPNTQLEYDIPGMGVGVKKPQATKTENTISLTKEEFYKLNSLDEELYNFAVQLATMA